MTNVCIIATIVIYLVGMLLVGFAYSKSNEDSTDFYLGGRKMGHAGRCPLSFDAGRIARQDARSAGQKRQDG